MYLYKYINKQHLTIKHKNGFYILYISAGNEGADNGVKRTYFKYIYIYKQMLQNDMYHIPRS